MKDKAENGNGAFALSPLTIAVLAVGSVLILYMLLQPLFFAKDDLPASSANPAPEAAPITRLVPPASVRSDGSAPPPDKAALVEPLAERDPLTERDPFIPAKVLAPAVMEPERQPAVKVPAEVESAVTPAVAPETERFAWKGVVGDCGPRQLILIRHHARTYFLRQGDPVPGTEYTVAEVTQDAVVLASPRELIRLVKKKEAKING